MSVVEMTKLKLIGMTACKQNILNALQKTGCTQLFFPDVEEDAVQPISSCQEEATAIFDKTERAINLIEDALNKSKGKDYLPPDYKDAKENFFVDYNTFVSIVDRQEELLGLADEILSFDQKLAEIKSERVKLINLCSQLEPYIKIDDRFSDFHSTAKTTAFFGTVKGDAVANLEKFVEEKDCAFISVFTEDNSPVVLVVCLNESADEFSLKLNECGFVKCPFNYCDSPKDVLSKTIKQMDKLDTQNEEIYKVTCKYYKSLKDLKILNDYYKFEIEKESDSNNFSYTKSTFTLNAYLPKENEEEVKTALMEVSDAIYLDFSVPDNSDNPPTLTKNNKIVRQTEFITDLYSSPNYREIDPNKVLYFFFMLFMGVIMADIGYGILMAVIGYILQSKIKVENGSKKLWNVISMAGLFTILFGVLFNSFFGYEVLPFRILPNPVPSDTGNDDLMTVLLLCLLLGVIQIAVGYFMKGLNLLRSGDPFGSISEGFIWVLFFVGFIMSTFNFLIDYLMSDSFVMNETLRSTFDKLTKPGLYILLGSLLFATLTAGRKERGFGKFTKGFGAVYGLINIMSDILSYARLFGLMLSGMIIAQTFNDIGSGLFNGTALGYVMGGLVMVLGHTFNLLMGVLGAYIHDSRLQYIEFFGKFYTGEGDKFVPFGSKTRFIYLTK